MLAFEISTLNDYRSRKTHYHKNRVLKERLPLPWNLRPHNHIKLRNISATMSAFNAHVPKGNYFDSLHFNSRKGTFSTTFRRIMKPIKLYHAPQQVWFIHFTSLHLFDLTDLSVGVLTFQVHLHFTTLEALTTASKELFISQSPISYFTPE